MPIDFVFLVSHPRFEERFVATLAPEIKIYSNMSFRELILQKAVSQLPEVSPVPFFPGNETSITSIVSYQAKPGDRFPDYWAGRGPAGYRLRVDTVGTFDIYADGRRVSCAPTEISSSESIANWFLGPVLGLALALNYNFCLHSSAVQVHNQAVGFLGASGGGKSTLCAGFRKLGMPLVTDDLLLLRHVNGTYLSFPVFMRQRIWTETRHFLESGPHQTPPLSRRKEFLEMDKRDFPAAPHGIPPQVIYLLQPQSPSNQDIEITPLSAQEAMITMIQYTVAARLFDPSLAARHFAFCAGLAQQVAVRRLSYPHIFSSFPEVQQAILDDLAQSLQS